MTDELICINTPYNLSNSQRVEVATFNIFSRPPFMVASEPGGLIVNNVLSNIKVVSIQHAISRDEILTLMAETALDAGWAKPGFTEALLVREEKYPTGLHTQGVEIAIPHADPEWTTTPGMVVGVLENPVPFQPMGGVGDDVMASFVFMLVIPDAEAHMTFLQALAEYIENEAYLMELGNSRDINPLLDFLAQKLEPQPVERSGGTIA
jgi:PTS system galactitol-specific IIA component